MIRTLKSGLLLLLLLASTLPAQERIQVTFRYAASSSRALRAYAPGTFNNWGPNIGGRIAVDAPSRMDYDDSLRCFVKRVALIPGNRVEYKFHEQYDAQGAQWQWFTDPLNPGVNASDNNNSILIPGKAMVFQIVPRQGAVVRESRPALVAGVSAADGDSILADRSSVFLDGRLFSTFEGRLLAGLSVLKVPLTGLENGIHRVLIRVETRNGESALDSTSFTAVTGDVFFMTPSIDTVLAETKTIRWFVGMGQRRPKTVTLKQIGRYPLAFPAESEKEYAAAVDLRAGENLYVVSVEDSSGRTAESDTLRLRYPGPQKPEPKITFRMDGGRIAATGEDLRPGHGSGTFLWSEQATNPAVLEGVEGRTGETLTLDVPRIPGDYALKLTVTDAGGNSNSTVHFFSVGSDASVALPGSATVPLWAAGARIYSMFVRSFTSSGTLRAASDSLEHVRNLGFNVVWVLPVMDVEGQLDQNTNIGYNIVDFYRVEPCYGTLDDFKAFVRRAHALGLRVILDVTPNHTSRSHPFALDVRSKKKYSRYYDFYQHEIIPHETNGLGQTLCPDGIVYYTGFSDALLNWNWGDGEARRYMTDVYTHWLREYDLDGFRLDVYWGPHRRYGVDRFDVPLRAALRAAKADILILGETAGTGSGTEDQYADRGGGMDAGYDWNLLGTVSGFPSIGALDNTLYNGGYRPGPNSLYLRFLENHDELRVAARYNSIGKTLPVSAAVFLATGMPMLYQGQEFGMGFQMTGGKDFLARSTINWRNPPAAVLAPHYQKLAQIRAQFPAFSRQPVDSNGDHGIDGRDKNVQPRLAASSADIYAFGRPYPDQNGVVVANFSGEPRRFRLALDPGGWAEFTEPIQAGRRYFVSDLYRNTVAAMTGAELDTLDLSLDAYGAAVLVLGIREESVRLPELFVRVEDKNLDSRPVSARLYPNFPNPFNPATAIQYDLEKEAEVRMEIFDLAGRRVKTLVAGSRPPGRHLAAWDGIRADGLPAASGIYLCRFQAGAAVQTRKMILMR
jgi:cyclomaltodextrinase / maltogenic alpha-amylase / neopullulanase